MKAESPRKCKICGGPNHYGCGCEAKVRTNTINEYIFYLSEGNTSREQIIKAVKEFGAAVNVKLSEALQCSIDETPGALADYLGFFAAGPAAEAAEIEQPAAEALAEINTYDEALRNAARMADGVETLCTQIYDTNNYLKLIAGDMITIRKFLRKEDEVKNAG